MRKATIVLFRGHKPLQLYKITPEELPDFGKLRPVRVTDYIPAWRKLEEDKAAEAREKRARRQEAAQATPPQGGEARQPPPAPPQDVRPVPVHQTMAQAPRAETFPPVFHAREDNLPAYTPMRLVREDDRPRTGATHPTHAAAPQRLRSQPPPQVRREEPAAQPTPPQPTQPPPEHPSALPSGFLLKKTGDEISVEELLGRKTETE